jgi:hypothetical protein
VNPSGAPTDVGQHWINKATGDQWISNGTASVANWIPWTADTGITQLTGDVTAGPGNGSQVATISNSAVTNAKVASGIDAVKIGSGSVDNTEFGYLNGVTSSIQTQIDAKVDGNVAITGATKTKVTYDAKGLVTVGADADIADITGLQTALNTKATISQSDLAVTYTGNFTYPYLFQFAVPSKYSFRGTFKSFTGKWIEFFNYQESSTVTNSLRLVTLSFDDLEGLVGLVNLNICTALTTLAFPELKFMGGAFTVNNCASFTTLSIPKLEAMNGGFNIQSTPLITSISAPELKVVQGNVNISSTAALTTMSFPKLESAQGIVASTTAALTSFSFPLLEYISTAGISASSAGSLLTYDFPALKYCLGTIGASGITTLTTMNFPNLLRVGGINTLSGNALATMTFTSLTHSGNISLSFVNALPSLSLPAMQNVTSVTIGSATIFTTLSMPSMVDYTGTGTTISATSLAALTTASIGTVGTLKSIAGNVTFSACALNQASVDGILKAIASLDGTNGTTSWGTGKTLTLNGGTNSAPSYTGGTPPTKAGSAFVGSGTTCTVSWVGHGYTTGDLLTISGITTLTNANGTFSITVVNANTFTYTIVSQTATGGGTATVKKAGATTDGFYAQQQIIVRGATVTTN